MQRSESMEPIDLRAELDRAAALGEPPLTVDTDRLVAAGYARLRRRQAMRGAGVAVLAIVVIAVPTLVFAGPGIGAGPVPAGRGSGGSTIEPTPGAPHGGCRGPIQSGSTQAYAMARWLEPHLPARQRYSTIREWQTASREDCVDGARQDQNDVVFRLRGRSGDIHVITARNEPAERVVRPCHPAGTASASASGTPTGQPGTGSPTGGATASPTVPPPNGGSRFTNCGMLPQAGGGTLTVEELRSPGSPNTSPGIPLVSRVVAFWRPDGTVVTVVADNRYVGEAPPSRQPPLTITEMVALVKSSGLQLYIPPRR
jgi:hypothetical protein